MRLLFDQNLSFQLVQLLSDIYPNAVHVRSINMKDVDDSIIWDYAKARDLIIVSKDSDYHQKSFLYGFPPKVIWVRLGNCTTNDVEQLLRKNKEVIVKFSFDKYASFLILS